MSARLLDAAELAAPPAAPVAVVRLASVDAIHSIVAQSYGVSLDELLSRDRHKTLVEARQVVMWFLRERGYSLPEIGRLVGGRDHTTVMAALAKLRRRPEILDRAAARLERLR